MRSLQSEGRGGSGSDRDLGGITRVGRLGQPTSPELQRTYPDGTRERCTLPIQASRALMTTVRLCSTWRTHEDPRDRENGAVAGKTTLSLPACLVVPQSVRVLCTPGPQRGYDFPVPVDGRIPFLG